jgi:hypothetical protein
MVFRRFLTPKALYSKAQGQRRRECGIAPPWVIVEQNGLRRRRYTGRLTVALFLWNAFSVRVSAALHPGCAADHGYAPVTAILGFGIQPLRGKESDRSASDDALDEESLTALPLTPLTPTLSPKLFAASFLNN